MISQKEIDRQMLELDREIILMLGESAVRKISINVWLCKKDDGIEEACMNNNVVGINYMIEQHGYRIESILNFGAEYGRLDIVKLAIEVYNINIRREDNYALCIAVENNHLEVIEYLIEKGADIHSNDNHILRHAAKAGYLDIVKFAIGKGGISQADIDRALCTAIQYNHIAIVEYLVETASANIHANNESPLIIAAQYRQFDMVEYFVKKSANINSSALEAAITTGRLDIVKLLVKNYSADIHDDNEILRIAIKYEYMKILGYLLELGFEIYLALHISAEYGKLDIIKLLVENYGADIHDDSIICYAIEGGYMSILEYLVENGVHVRNNKGALRYAIECKHLDIVKYLLENGAQYN
jgi:ankyrin repeat protein